MQQENITTKKGKYSPLKFFSYPVNLHHRESMRSCSLNTGGLPQQRNWTWLQTLEPHTSKSNLKGKIIQTKEKGGFPGGSEIKASACNVGDLGSIPGSGRSPGEGNGNPLQYSCLENPMDGGAWWATVHGLQRVRHDWSTRRRRRRKESREESTLPD